MDANPRYAYPIPPRELERRRRLVSQAMKKQGIDCLVMQGDNLFQSGYVRYFTDMAVDTYRTTVLFSAKKETLTIWHGGYLDPPIPPDFANNGITRRKLVPYIQSMIGESEEQGKLAVEYIRDNRFKKIGLVGFGTLSAGFYKYLMQELGDIEMTDATELIDRIKAIKSADEMAMIQKCVTLHDHMVSALPALIYPGIDENQIKAELKKMAIELGSETQNIRHGTGVKRVGMVDPFFNHRVVNAGDEMCVLVEVNGPGGFFGELARPGVLGKPSKELSKAYEAVLRVHELVAAALKPGVTAAELLRINNEYMTKNGYQPESRLLGHSQGYDMVERPVMFPTETMAFEEGMFVAIHPTAWNDKAMCYMCTNYIVTKDGAKMLNAVPHGIQTI